jgi:hypothetical protein
VNHFLLLFIVLFGGFLAWGLWEIPKQRNRWVEDRLDEMKGTTDPLIISHLMQAYDYRELMNCRKKKSHDSP